jgi:hypothetical protein
MARSTCTLRNQLGHTEEADDSEGRNDEERGPPPDALPDVRAQRYADDIGDGEAGEHHGDRACLLLRGDQIGRDDRADTEEGAVGE